MKRSWVQAVTLTLLLIAGCSARESDTEWLAQLPGPWLLEADELAQVLPQFNKRYPEFQSRLRALALWRVGTPYSIFKLGEEVEPDPDPIFRLDVSDCTGHILTCLSMAQSASWAEARRSMIEIHYKQDRQGSKKPTYASRWHYTTDRILDNPATVSITERLVSQNRLAFAEVTLNRKSDGSEFLDLGWSRPVKAAYIPNGEINADLLARLPRVAGVAFVKPGWFSLGLVVGHEGMIIDGKDIIHASSEYGETVRMDFMEYYFREAGPLFGGIMLFEFHPLSDAS